PQSALPLLRLAIGGLDDRQPAFPAQPIQSPPWKALGEKLQSPRNVIDPDHVLVLERRRRDGREEYPARETLALGRRSTRQHERVVDVRLLARVFGTPHDARHLARRGELTRQKKTGTRQDEPGERRELGPWKPPRKRAQPLYGQHRHHRQQAKIVDGPGITHRV